MLEQILQHLKNWFEVSHECGAWVIKDGIIYAENGTEFAGLQPNQFYRIRGSIFNDGLHKYTDMSDELVDESFEGSIDALAIPTALIKLTHEIEAWQDKNGNELDKAFESESFGGYSYTRAKDANGNTVTWQNVFRTRLNPWRKT